MTLLHRRTFLAGATAGLAALGLGVRGTSRAAPAAQARNLLLVIARGGWDVTYALDPKPDTPGVDAPAGTVQNFGGLPIFVNDDRPGVTSFFDAHASRCALVRGIEVRSIAHLDCSARMLTGTSSETSPDVGAIVAYELGLERPVPYLVLGRTSFTGPHAAIATRAGTTNQLHALIDPNSVIWIAATPPVSWRPDDVEAGFMRAYVEHRAAAVKTAQGYGESGRRLDDFLGAIDRAESLKATGELGSINFNRDLGPQTEVALAALEQGLSRAVQIEFDDFDTHVGNSAQATLHDALFSGLTALVDEMSVRTGPSGASLLDETVIAVISEMGRTPRLNGDDG
ncbi:MAG: DUF1501 domain-containing protein, partial [Myxococcales bacterium]|nr:DUF1501 domain-containing protein [Myxococcales bacterium]